MDREVLEDGHVAGEPRLSEDAVHAAEGDSRPPQQQRRQPEQPAVPRPRSEGETPESLNRRRWDNGVGGKRGKGYSKAVNAVGSC